MMYDVLLLAVVLCGLCNSAHASFLPRRGESSPFFISTRGGSTRALDKDKNSATTSSPSRTQQSNQLNSVDSDNTAASNSKEDEDSRENADEANDSDSVDPNTLLYVTKKDGTLEPLEEQKILQRFKNLSFGLDLRFISLSDLAEAILQGTYPNITTAEIDTLASETAASKSTRHPHYARLAARICATANHKSTSDSFSSTMLQLNGGGNGFVSNEIAELVRRRGREIDRQIHHERDLEMSYFGFKTLERSYLLKRDQETIVERPQYMWMRVALGIHCCKPQCGGNGNGDSDDGDGSTFSKDEEDVNLEAAFETYKLMSLGYFTHATPTLFHAGTIHPQLCSCFLLQMSDDSIKGIYDTLKRCAVISKAAGGIGLSVNKVRARGTFIKGTRGISNGLVPMLRVYDSTSHYVDQGGGKRPGAFAIYIEPWHADIFDVLNLRKNHGKEEQRARNLFYGLWVPDLFMKRVEEDGLWSLMCPNECLGLAECHGDEFERMYKKYEQEKKYIRQVRARVLWAAILDAQIETGTPYLLYKDAANNKSNQQNLGTIQCSNLCTEIIQYTDEDEVAVCNLASICLSKFVISERGETYGSTYAMASTALGGARAYFDHVKLHNVAKIITKNLDKVIDVNQYPIEGAKKSNRSHRPIGIGVSGLADTFLRLGLPFESVQAKKLNEAIFETIYHASLEASNEIAQKKGTYDTFEGSPASMGKLQFNLWGLRDDETPSRRRRNSKNNSTEKENNSLNDEDILQRYSKECKENGYDWDKLRQKIILGGGLRNSLLIAPMPTASTSQILGVNECFEPFASNLYVRRVKAGEFIIVNPHLIQDLTDLGLWNRNVRNQLMRDGGSVARINCVPEELKELYKTVWDMKMKDIIDMAADRGKFIDQSQSLNLFMAVPTVNKLTAMHFYAWKKGLKTGMYYLRTRPAVNAIQYTVPKSTITDKNQGVVAAAQQTSGLPELKDGQCSGCSV